MGLLDTKQQPVGGLLGGGQGQRLGFGDYALALLAGGVRGAAGLALQDHMQRREHDRQQPFVDELTQAFAPHQAAPQMQGPGMDGAPVSSPQASPGGPSIESLAPLLLKARQGGVDVSPYLDLFQGITAARTADQPKIFNTGPELLSYDPRSRAITTLHTDPAKPEPIPVGYRRKADGHGMEIDPDYLAGQLQLAGGRRDVVVKNPLPSRARAPSAGSVSNGLPPGYVAR